MTPRARACSIVLLLLLGGCAGKAPSASGTSSSGASAASSSGAVPGQRIEVSIAHGKVTGATGRVQVATGTPVTLVVTSDVADEVHLHGYDIEKDLEPGKPTTLQFTATMTGVFEVELHKANLVLLHIQVG